MVIGQGIFNHFEDSIEAIIVRDEDVTDLRVCPEVVEGEVGAVCISG